MASSEQGLLLVYDNVALVNSSARVSFNVTLLPSGRVYVDYHRFVDAGRVGYTVATNRGAGASASAAINALLEGALGMGAITTLNSDIGGQSSAFLPSAAGVPGSQQRPFLIGLRAPSPGVDPKLARFPLHTRTASSASRPALDLAALALINSGASGVPPTAAMADASVVAAVAWQATASFPNPVSDAWNWSAAARGVYPPLEALRGIANVGVASTVAYCPLGTDMCMVPQWGVWDGGAPVYFMFPGVACADLVRFRCRFGNAATNETGTGSDGLVNAAFDGNAGALVCTAPPAPPVSASVLAVTVTVQLLANGVPLASTRPLLYTYRRVSLASTTSAIADELLLSPAQRDLLMKPQRYLCEMCAASMPEALAAASIPTSATSSDPSIVNPSDFSGTVIRWRQ